MAKEFIGNAANTYLVPTTEGEGDQAVRKFLTMAELILMTIEADYQLDDKLKIIKTTKLETTRIHISLDNLAKYIDNLSALHDQLEAFATQDEQQRAGVDPAQMSLPV